MARPLGESQGRGRADRQVAQWLGPVVMWMMSEPRRDVDDASHALCFTERRYEREVLRAAPG
jgi:hypothetical protein